MPLTGCCLRYLCLRKLYGAERSCGCVGHACMLIACVAPLYQTSVRIKLLAVQVINRLAGQEFVFEKVQRIVKDALPGTSDLKVTTPLAHAHARA